MSSPRSRPFSSTASSRPSRSRPIAVGIIAGAALSVALPLAAAAHVNVTPSSTAAGSTTQLTFGVGHGCDGSSTTALTFTIPEEFVSVTPNVNPNWTAEKVMVDLAEPITDAHGNSLVQRVGQVVYTAKTPLVDGFRDTLTLQVTLPEGADGSTIAFPVLQSCEVGETNWNELADEGQDAHELEHPAPTVAVSAAEAEHGAAVPGVDLAARSSTAAAAVQSEPDVVARGLGLAGLVIGLAGIVFAVLSRRRAVPVAPSEGHHS